MDLSGCGSGLLPINLATPDRRKEAEMADDRLTNQNESERPEPFARVPLSLQIQN